MNNIELSKYKEETLLTPLDKEIDLLPADKQLALCLMSLERIYTTYFIKYDKKGIKIFASLLDILEQALFVGEVPETNNVDMLVDWCDQSVDKLDDGRISEWKQCVIEILFPEDLCQFVASLDGICLRKNPFEFKSIYKVGINLCELYEMDFWHTSDVDFMSLHEFVGMRHQDVADALKIAKEKANLYKRKKLSRQEYFDALDVLDGLCAKYPEDSMLYAQRQRKPPESPEDLILTHKEAERIKSDVLFLKQCGKIPNNKLRKRLDTYRNINILHL